MKGGAVRVLVLGYGNPGRLDDGIGSAVASAVEAMGLPGVVCESDYQLNIEHAEMIAGFDEAVFADATVEGEAPFYFRALPDSGGPEFTTHAMSPGAVVALARGAFGWRGRAWLLGVRGERFNDYREGLSPIASANVRAAAARLGAAIGSGDLGSMTTGEGAGDPPPACDGGVSCATASL